MHSFCQNCKSDVEPGVDRNTLGLNKKVTADTKAICPECMKPMNLSSYMINSLASMGQFYSRPKAEQAFSFDCAFCEKIAVAKD